MLRILAICLLVMIATVASATAEDLGRYRIDPSFSKEEAYLCPSRSFIETAPDLYFKVFGEWPASFAQIQDAGLLRSNLTMDGVYVVTPDDGVLDGPQDMAYYPARGSGTPSIASQGRIRGGYHNPMIAAAAGSALAIARPAMDATDTWEGAARLSIEELQSDNPGGIHDTEIARLQNRLGNLELQKLLSIAQLCALGLEAYQTCNGHYPAAWADFVDTGFCPVTSDMLNPATGQPFATDGSAFSFSFNYDETGASVSVLGADGAAL